jgi:hypothetical protein
MLGSVSSLTWREIELRVLAPSVLESGIWALKYVEAAFGQAHVRTAPCLAVLKTYVSPEISLTMLASEVLATIFAQQGVVVAEAAGR